MKRLLLWLALGKLASLTVAAHGLTVDWQVVDRHLVVVGRTEDAPAAGANVELRSATGEPIAEGVLDDAGRYRWPIGTTGDVAVVVNAGLGHRRTVIVPAAALGPGATQSVNPLQAGGPATTRGTGVRGSADGSYPLAVRVLVGLSFLLATVAAGLSLGNRRRLLRLEQRWEEHESRG